MTNGRENLIPLHERTEEEQRKIRKKGGQSRSPKKSISARLRWLREKKVNDESAKKLIEMYENKDITHIDLLAFLQKWRTKVTDIKDAVLISRLLLDWSKQVHGTEAIGTQVNIQNNTHIDDNRIYEVYQQSLKRKAVKKRSKKSVKKRTSKKS